ncbi:hypothetical protein PybrP1_007087 [[Pythium] brassicae (nom. inval.)]|nr:hypothetical protein PybrP1_007087 [[Pythium] brassicae (nom. inval.)]
MPQSSSSISASIALALPLNERVVDMVRAHHETRRRTSRSCWRSRQRSSALVVNNLKEQRLKPFDAKKKRKQVPPQPTNSTSSCSSDTGSGSDSCTFLSKEERLQTLMISKAFVRLLLVLWCVDECVTGTKRGCRGCERQKSYQRPETETRGQKHGGNESASATVATSVGYIRQENLGHRQPGIPLARLKPPVQNFSLFSNTRSEMEGESGRRLVRSKLMRK